MKVHCGQALGDILLVPKGTLISKLEVDLLRILQIKASQSKPNIEAVFVRGYRLDPQHASIEAIKNSFIQGVQQVAALSVQLGIPNASTIPFYVRTGYTNILSVCLQLGIPLRLRKKATLLPLLHRIMPYLTLKDIFSCIQVCKSWSNAILSNDNIWYFVFMLIHQKSTPSENISRRNTKWRYVLKQYLEKRKLNHQIESLQKLQTPDEQLYREILNSITNLKKLSVLQRLLETAVLHFHPSWTDEQQILWYDFVANILSLHSENFLGGALIHSLKHNDYRLTNYLFSQYKQKDSNTKLSWRFFYEAVQRGCSLNIVKIFVDSNIKYNITDCTRDGQTIMHIAVLNNSLEVMKFLLSLGSMKDAYDNQFNTPLMLVLQHRPSQFQVCFITNPNVCNRKSLNSYLKMVLIQTAPIMIILPL